MISFCGYTSDNKINEAAASAMLNDMCDKATAVEICSANNFVCGKKNLSEEFSTGALSYDDVADKLIVFSGKLYNKPELADLVGASADCDDAKLVLLCFEKFGKDAVLKLSGMFAFAIYDKADGSIFLARDRFGIKPIYYYTEGNTFIFASRLKGFDANPEFTKVFNESLLLPYLCFNSTPSSETFYKGVLRLDPGCYLEFKDGTATKSCYYKLTFKTEDKTITEFADEIHDAVSASIKRQTEGVEFASFLSGGVDSSYFASAAKPDVTYTVGYDNQRYDESVHTTELAAALGIKNKVRRISSEEYLNEFENIIKGMDEPLADPSAAALYFGMKEAAKDVKVVMSGEGADELFGGYNSYLEEITHQNYMKRPYFVRHMAYLLTCRLPESRKFNFFYRRGQKLKNFHIGLDRVYKDHQAQKILKVKKQKTTRQVMAPLYNAYKDANTLQQRQAVDFYFWLIGDFVHAVTRSGDSFGVQARFPFLDRDICSVAMKLPNDAKISMENTKLAFRLAAEKVIPTDAYKRKKLGFPVPLKEWVKEDAYYNKMKAKFESETAKKFFKTKELVKMLDDHRAEKRDCYKKVWTVYTFLVWYDLYFS